MSSRYTKLENTSNRYIPTGYTIPTTSVSASCPGCKPLPNAKFDPGQDPTTWCLNTCCYSDTVDCNTCKEKCDPACFEGKCSQPPPPPPPAPKRCPSGSWSQNGYEPCNRCTTCESGIAKACTQTSDTQCKKELLAECTQNSDCKSSYCSGGVINFTNYDTFNSSSDQINGLSYPASCGFDAGAHGMVDCKINDKECRDKLFEFTFMPYDKCTCALNYNCVDGDSSNCNTPMKTWGSPGSGALFLGKACDGKCTQNSDCASGWCFTQAGICSNVGNTVETHYCTDNPDGTPVVIPRNS